MVTLKIHTKDQREKETIAMAIHTGLRGYEEYLKDKIILNFTNQEEIVLNIGAGARYYAPEIDTTINLDMHKENVDE